MLLSESTEEGLIISSLSMVSLVKVLKEGADYVLARRINLDPLEAYFGQQRAKNHRCDAPTVKSCESNARIIDIGKSSVSGSNVTLN